MHYWSSRKGWCRLVVVYNPVSLHLHHKMRATNNIVHKVVINSHRHLLLPSHGHVLNSRNFLNDNLPDNVNPVLFESLDATMIRSAAFSSWSFWPRRTQATKQKDTARLRQQHKRRTTSKANSSHGIGKRKGASIWVVALSTAEHNFTLHKGSFQETPCPRYGWESSRMPSHCVCSCKFLVELALSCPWGALPSIRHNDIRDLTADLLTEVCPNVTVEPDLQS